MGQQESVTRVRRMHPGMCCAHVSGGFTPNEGSSSLTGVSRPCGSLPASRSMNSMLHGIHGSASSSVEVLGAVRRTGKYACMHGCKSTHAEVNTFVFEAIQYCDRFVRGTPGTWQRCRIGVKTERLCHAVVAGRNLGGQWPIATLSRTRARCGCQ